MTKKNILICDDSQEMSRALGEKVKKIKSVRQDFFEPILIGSDLKEIIFALEERQKMAKNAKIYDYPTDDAAKVFDDAEVLVIDYSLFELDASLTGERIAYLARCYSSCGLIIALNQNPPYVEEYFDLTLRGHLESYADLNIPSNSLFNPNLWNKKWKGFHPWSWPIVIQAVEKYKCRIEEIQGHLDEPILEFLGFTEMTALTLPRSTAEFISRRNPEEATFRNFVDSQGSGNGLRGRNEKPINEMSIARIAAARIANWIEYDILPGQDILVDAPHLILRFPSMLKNKNKFSSVCSYEEPSEIGINEAVETFRFQRKNWCSRPVWFWGNLRDNPDIEENKDPFNAKRLGKVFCEDTSTFEEKDDAREFVADLKSSYSRRFVKKLENIQYSPVVRFSL